jgi:hypothetical protein
VSLLDRGNQCVIVYPEEVVEDADGNIKTQPAKCGFHARARIQPIGQSGTSARRAEQDNEGFETEKMYSLRFPRGFKCVLGAQSQVEWMGVRWAVHGDAMHFRASPRTAHLTYVLRRF